MNWYKKAKIGRDYLPPDTVDIMEGEEGRSSRGKSFCPQCGTSCKVTSCSDVGGTWWYCPNCGLVD